MQKQQFTNSWNLFQKILIALMIHLWGTFEMEIITFVMK